MLYTLLHVGFTFFHSLGKYFWLPLSFEVINLETIPIAYQLTPYSITFTHVHIYTDLLEAKFFASTFILLVLLKTTDFTVKLPQSSYIPKATLNLLSRLFQYLKSHFSSFHALCIFHQWYSFWQRYCWSQYTFCILILFVCIASIGNLFVFYNWINQIQLDKKACNKHPPNEQTEDIKKKVKDVMHTLSIQATLLFYFDRNHLRQKCSHSLSIFAFVKKFLFLSTDYIKTSLWI